MHWLEKVIGGPRECMGVGSADDYRRRALSNLQNYKNRGFPVDVAITVMSGHPMAYIAQGRWLVDCERPGCENGVIVSRAWEMGVCYECGAEYHPVFPADADRAEAILLRRPIQNRNYIASPARAAALGMRRAETAVDLAAENIERGIDRPPRVGEP